MITQNIKGRHLQKTFFLVAKSVQISRIVSIWHSRIRMYDVSGVHISYKQYLEHPRLKLMN